MTWWALRPEARCRDDRLTAVSAMVSSQEDLRLMLASGCNKQHSSQFLTAKNILKILFVLLYL
jgi:hypothetical protein